MPRTILLLAPTFAAAVVLRGIHESILIYNDAIVTAPPVDPDTVAERVAEGARTLRAKLEAALHHESRRIESERRNVYAITAAAEAMERVEPIYIDNPPPEQSPLAEN